MSNTDNKTDISFENGIRDVSQISGGKKLVLGLQQVFTMFGATVVVPLITGLDVSVAIFMSGVGTLLFHLITGGKVPVYLGSSFAFIAPILAVTEIADLAHAQGGIVIGGLLYLILAILIKIFGYDRIISWFPPIVTGPIIMVIGLSLASSGIDMASGNWLLAIASLATIIIVSIYGKGFIKIIPIIMGIAVGYIVAIITGNVDFTPIAEASWFGLPNFRMAKFSGNTILMVAPVAVATMIEHIGDILAVGATVGVGDEFIKDPGLTRTLIGDGLATSLSAMFGGPANTTYSENTGALALTKVFDPLIMRIAAVIAIILGLVPKIGAVINTIPTSVVGGISIMLYGMIAAIGARTLVENQVDFTEQRNLVIASVIFILGLGGAMINIGPVQIGGMALAAIVGIILNKILPQPKEESEEI